MGLRGRGARPIKATRRRPIWLRKGLARPERVTAFLESLPITKGHLAGKKMSLLPAQRAFVEAVYGQLDGDGRRIVRLAVQSLPRGNGKTGFLSGLALAHLAGPESIERGGCYSAAIDRGQASLLFDEMRAIIEAVPALRERVNVVRHFKRLEVLDGPGKGSTYEALSSDARRGHGLAPSFWVFDELGQVKSRDLLDALMTAMGKQPQGLGVIISTQAAGDEHPLSQLLDDALSGIDPSMFVQLFAAPTDADPFDEAVWRACNPAFGAFLDAEDFRRQAERAKRMPSFLSAFRNLRLNQRVNADPRFVSGDDWNACAGEIDVESLRGRACWGGLDLSSTRDLSALTLIFEPERDGIIPVLAWFWLPGDTIEEREIDDKVPYRQWKHEGFIETFPGRAIDRRAIALRLAEIGADYDVQGIAFDEWRFADLQKILDEESIRLPLRKFRQGFRSMAGAVDAMESAILNRTLRHAKHPTLTMCLRNCVVSMDPAGNRKLDKARSRARIDGAVALAMAFGLRAIEPPQIVYNFDRPLVFIA